MFIDARSIHDGATLDTDVCVIGAGAAGITLAVELANARMRVALLESGGLDLDGQTQFLYDGKNLGLPYFPLTSTRLRFFGGTTNHWHGQCRPLDPIDFQERAWVSFSGWPFDKSHLDPYYRRAHTVCELGNYDYEPQGWLRLGELPLALDPARVRTVMTQISAPTRFGQVYRGRLEKAANITTYLHANVVEIVAPEPADSVRQVRIATLGGNALTMKARVFILATGGIENARLLLASRGSRESGLGNSNDLVGRYFMEHLSVPSGLFIPSDARWQPGIYRRYAVHAETRTRAFGYLTLAPETQEKERVLNIRTAFLTARRWLEALEATTPGIVAARNLHGYASSAETADHLRTILADLDNISIYAYRRLFRPDPQCYWLHDHLEQAPNHDSRVVLSEERDQLGQYRADLDWRLTELDRHTYRRAAQVIAEELGRSGVGRVRKVVADPETGWPELPRTLEGAWHHIGTTRMHRHATRGVVDENCRVHGIGNLYVAGSSVFPTSGHANPTLTIVALAIRLADRMKELFA